MDKPAAFPACLLILKGHTYGVTSVAFSPDGATLASGSGDNTVRLWDVATGAELRVLEGHTSCVTSVAFLPDGATLASGSRDNTVRLWEVATGAELRVLEGHMDWVRSVAFSPDGATLASGSGTVRLWDVATGAELRVLEGRTSYVTSVAFSPDGATLASSSGDKTVRLWNVATGAELRVLEGHTSYVMSVAFSPDGATLASGSDDKTVRLWDVPTGAPRQTLSLYAGDRGLDLAQFLRFQGVPEWQAESHGAAATLPCELGRDNCTVVVPLPPYVNLRSGSTSAAAGNQAQSIRLALPHGRTPLVACAIARVAPPPSPHSLALFIFTKEGPVLRYMAGAAAPSWRGTIRVLVAVGIMLGVALC